MFANACQKALGYTRPVLVSTRMIDGTVRSDLGSFIVLNRDGWILTAGHIFDSFVKFQTDHNKIKEIRERNESMLANQKGPSTPIPLDPNYIQNHSFWWSWDRISFSQLYVDRQIDIAVAKLEGFRSDWVREYPVFADPEHVCIGKSICRGGFPFVSIKPTFDENMGAFQIPKINIQELFYPNDGMISRIFNLGRSKEGNFEVKHILATSPGIKGQSGGPVFDTDGKIIGMQLMTRHEPLGFSPMIEVDGKKVIENQFLNVGAALHVSTILQFLDDKKISYQKEGDESGFRIID